MFSKRSISLHLYTFSLAIFFALITASHGWASKTCIKGNCVNGFGAMELDNGAVYKGQFQNGKMHGEGEYLWPKNDKYHKEYAGSFFEDTLHGYGVMHHADGNIYQGFLKNSERHGTGKMTWPNGQTYVGQWKKGKYSGFGIMSLSNGARYVGQWDETRSGLGVLRRPDGALYLGNWSLGKRNGKGRMLLPNGESHAGDWQDGELSKETKSSQENVPDTKTSGALYLLFLKEFATSCLQGKKIVGSPGFARVRTKETLNLRSQPVFRKNIVKKLKKDSYVLTIKKKNNWTHVIDTSCSTGWVKSSYLVAYEEEIGTWTEEQIINAHVNNQVITPKVPVKKVVSKNTEQGIKELFKLPDVPVTASQPEIMALKSISTISGEIVLQLKLIANGRISKAEHFTLKAPQRLVIDLPGKWANPASIKLPKKNWWLQDVKIGLHENKLRIVCYTKMSGEILIDSKPTKNGLLLKIWKKVN